MKLGIDVDNVVVDLHKGFFDFYNSNFSPPMNFNAFEDYYLRTFLELTKEEELALWNEYHDSAFFDKVPFIEGARDAIEFLRRENELFFITARHSSWKEKTNRFFRDNFGEVNIIFSGDVYGGQSKDVICSNLGVNILIEDHKEHSKEYAEKGIKILLLDKPWNKGVEHENITRVYTWQEILTKLGEMKNANQ